GAPLLPNVVAPEPDRASLKLPLDILAKAGKPVILAGLGVLWDRASSELTSFAEKLGAPVLTTPNCKGVISEDHPLRAGCIIGGLIERKLVSEADLIVTVGLDAVELQPKRWPYRAPVLALSAVADTSSMVPATYEVVGNLRALLSRLVDWSSN